MIYVVELRYISGDLPNLERDMRVWLDRNRIKPEEFHHSSAPPGLAFRIAFNNQNDAAEFAQAFGGWIEGADAQGIAATRWVSPPSPRKAARRRMRDARRG